MNSIFVVTFGDAMSVLFLILLGLLLGGAAIYDKIAARKRGW